MAANPPPQQQRRKGGSTVPIVLILDSSVQSAVGTYCKTIIACGCFLSTGDVRRSDLTFAFRRSLQTLHPQMQVRPTDCIRAFQLGGGGIGPDGEARKLRKDGWIAGRIGLPEGRRRCSAGMLRNVASRGVLSSAWELGQPAYGRARQPH